MPEFILEGAGAPEFQALDSFTQGYVEALFFTSCEPGKTRDEWNPETDSSLPGDVGFCDLSPESVARIVRDCRAFQAVYRRLLRRAYEREYDSEQAGRDLWFTRCGHGVGYWDRSELEADGLGDSLSEVATRCGNVDPYLGDDGLVYLM